jgi:hypothetical protein
VPRPRPTSAADAPPTATPTSASLLKTAEAEYLPKMSKGLGDILRAQPWFQQMTPADVSMIAAILECDRASGARGEKQSVVDALNYAIEQPWYADGLDDTEAAGLRGVFQVYAASLSDQRNPQIGPVLATTIRYQLVNVMQLPESGEMVLMVSADDAALGRKALDLATAYLPQVEGITGKFPYKFLYISVTDLPEFLGGLSYDEFIALSPEHVDDEVVAHELTHATLYGIFPTWFEEGFAYFMGRYLTGQLEASVAEYKSELKSVGVGTKLNVGPKPGYNDYDYLVDISTGFLFMNALYEANGIESVAETIRSLRTKTFTDQDLIRTLVQSGPPEQQQRVKQVICDNVIGTTRNYCVPNTVY